MATASGKFEADKVVGSAATEAEQITVQPIPKPIAVTGGRGSSRKFQRERAMTGPGHDFTELLFVRGEDADAAAPARDRDIPLLRVRRGLDGRIGEQDVIHSLAL